MQPVVDTPMRALVVDDDDGVRTLVVDLLEREGFEAVEADRGDAGVALLTEHAPHVAVIDVQMPGMSGYEVCLELRRRFGDHIAIVFVSGSRTEPLDRVAGFQFGADDYIVKPFDPEEFLARVRAIVRRVHAVRTQQDGPGRLTPRELQVLRLLGQGKRTAAIAGELVLSPKTVGKHVERILKKLKVHSRAEAVSFAYRHGLLR